MKTLIENTTNISKYIWGDDAVVVVGQDITITPDYVIADMNINNATMVEEVTPPTDWIGCKYLYSEGTWTLNPDWIDPTLELSANTVSDTPQ
jgi:hypothetical protein